MPGRTGAGRSLVGTNGRTLAGDMLLEHGERDFALGCPRGPRDANVDEQAVAVLHQRMPMASTWTMCLARSLWSELACEPRASDIDTDSALPRPPHCRPSRGTTWSSRYRCAKSPTARRRSRS